MKKTSVLFCLLLALTMAVSVAQAQETLNTATSTPDIQEGIKVAEEQGITLSNTIATVNIYNAKVVSQQGGSLTISFDLFNREGVQPQVKYAVVLTKTDYTGSMVPVDEKIYDEAVDLGPAQTVTKTVGYEAPSYLKGTFQVWIDSRNAKGFPFGRTMLGEVSLTGTGQYMEIITNSCFVTVLGDASSTPYALGDGVDISANETILGTCDVQNYFDKQINVTPRFETRIRTYFGEVVPDNNIKQSPVSFGVSEKKTITFSIPKANTPQAYDAILSLYDEEGQKISNSVAFHYVIQGAGATIQNILLDKNYYQKGDIAKLSVIFTPSADSFYGSRSGQGTEVAQYSMLLSMKDKDGTLCADEFTRVVGINDYPSVNSDIPITRDCIDPSVSVSITDGNGTVFDQNTFAITSDMPTQGNNWLRIGIIIIAVIIFALLAFFVIKKRTSIAKPLIVLLIAVSGMLGTVAYADTASICLPSGTALGINGAYALCGARNIYMTYQLDNSTYSPNQNMTGTSIFSSSDCYNNWAGTGGVDWLIPTRGESTLVPYIGNNASGWYSAIKQAPSAPGNYNATFTFKYHMGTDMVYEYLTTGGWSAVGVDLYNDVAQLWNSSHRNCSYLNSYYGSNNISCTETTETDHYYYAQCGDGCTNVHVGKYNPTYFFERQVCWDTCEMQIWYAPNGVQSYYDGYSAFRVFPETVRTITYTVIYKYPYNIPFTVIGADCTLPWGGTLANGSSVTAYQSSSGTSCQSETRTCNNGSLSGSYTYASCTVTAPSVTFSANPTTVTYNSSSTLSWSSVGATSCTAGGSWSGTQSTSGSWNTGNLTSSQTYTLFCTGPGGNSAVQTVIVTVNAPVSCTLPWGGTLAHGSSVTAYQSATVSGGATCQSQTRTCNNGSLSGSYTNASCTVTAPTASLSVQALSMASPITANTSAVVPLTVEPTDTLNFNWNATEVSSCQNSFNSNTAITGSANGISIPAPGITTIYSLLCYGYNGTNPLRQFSITTREHVPILTPSSTSVTSGSTITLSYQLNGNTNCSLTGPGINLQNITTNGVTAPIVITAQSTFTMQCDYGSRSVTVLLEGTVQEQ